MGRAIRPASFRSSVANSPTSDAEKIFAVLPIPHFVASRSTWMSVAFSGQYVMSY